MIRVVDIVYINLSKAFDKVLHCWLVQKFMIQGIQDALANWIEKCLVIVRKLRVVVDWNISVWKYVINGVP